MEWKYLEGVKQAREIDYKDTVREAEMRVEIYCIGSTIKKGSPEYYQMLNDEIEAIEGKKELASIVVGFISAKSGKTDKIGFGEFTPIEGTFSVNGETYKYSNAGIEVVPKGVEGTSNAINASELKMSKTVQKHMNNIIKKGANKGDLARPYVDSNGTTMLVDEIMKGGTPVKDTALKNGLRWDVEGTFRGSTGTWELVVDTSSNTIVHFNFVAK